MPFYVMVSEDTDSTIKSVQSMHESGTWGEGGGGGQSSYGCTIKREKKK